MIPLDLEHLGRVGELAPRRAARLVAVLPRALMFSVLLDVGGLFWVSLTKSVQRSAVEVDTTRAEPL